MYYDDKVRPQAVTTKDVGLNGFESCAVFAHNRWEIIESNLQHFQFNAEASGRGVGLEQAPGGWSSLQSKSN